MTTAISKATLTSASRAKWALFYITHKVLTSFWSMSSRNTGLKVQTTCGLGKFVHYLFFCRESATGKIPITAQHFKGKMQIFTKHTKIDKVEI